ncbi:MAG: redox-regulated ATPase YchF [candidate division KSB1 bacterium]|nr:redox-regulated ATPase YchF [candidate division KSB1 bacterium]MDZ7274561.1 redox-regulated ATPase YchF [candidate division KSB1 bacterium]MDZ7284778.1 redox-regulated ATPase YchF [candidate division KSB1 bacterium]MDZ7297802.1 redox-regulated ATPase YchF [candidate division KSB1 bacterium]MDZ7306409.1 redox-regulated ATPase YchF [candidate division KSB1 bacterium]
MQIGIAGLPFAGKTTIFSTLLKHKSEEGAFHKPEMERGMVKVPDVRLDRLTAMFNPKKKVNAVIEYVKVQGMDSSGDKPLALTPQFLANLKNVDAIMLVVRAFENDRVPHPLNRIDPARDMHFINSEFLLSDLAVVESRLERLTKGLAKSKDELQVRELALMQRFHQQLEQEKPLRELELTAEEEKMIRGYQFLTLKPLLYVINIAEGEIARAAAIEQGLAAQVAPRCALTSLSAEIEREISELGEEDAAAFMADLGITEPALHKLIRTSYELLGLISFFTVGEDECRSWTIRRGTRAQQAAGVIHSDLEKGFIRAETVHYDDLIAQGSLHACREKGLLRLEGKDYVVKDGDILNIRFNV